MDCGLPLVPITGTGSGAPDRVSTRSASISALIAKAPPDRRWHSVQWQAWTIRGGELIRNRTSPQLQRPSNVVASGMASLPIMSHPSARSRSTGGLGMRKVTYGAAVSLDGFIAGPDESIGWLRMSEDVNAIMAESWKGVDAMLIGRKTHEFAARMGGGPGGMSKIKTYIFSRTL